MNAQLYQVILAPHVSEKSTRVAEKNSQIVFRARRDASKPAIKKINPTSHGRRSLVKVVNRDLHKGEPYAPLLEKKAKIDGRNNAGRICVRHRGGAHKRHYRVVDFLRDKDGIPGKIERFEYDPNRSANIALVLYKDGERRYIIAPKGAEGGTAGMAGPASPS